MTNSNTIAPNEEARERINRAAGEHHFWSKKILGIDWYDTESQARAVIRFFVQLLHDMEGR